jgi:hypothetical protein
MFENDLGLAIERFERCAELSGALGLPAIQARALQLLGVSRLELGDLYGAKSALARGVPAIVDIGDRCHAGIVNICRYARRLTKERALYAIVGGFHLNGPIFEPLIPRVLDDLGA